MNEEENIRGEKAPEQNPDSKNAGEEIKAVNTDQDSVLELAGIDAQQPVEIPSNQTSEKMEIHHSSHVHHSKKWKDYLYEFLMLFLAVTAGFFVENQREHFIENKRAEQFSKQLLSDLRLDSILFENRKRDLEARQKVHDQLLSLLTSETATTDKMILETLLPAAYAYDFPVTTTTYNQMKSSGSLRYIDNMALTASLQSYYDVLLPKYNSIIEASLNYFMQYLNPFYLKHIRIQDYDPFNDTLINKQAQIIDRNSKTDQELANIMGSYRSLLKIQSVTMNEPVLDKIKETMVLLRREFDLP